MMLLPFLPLLPEVQAGWDIKTTGGDKYGGGFVAENVGNWVTVAPSGTAFTAHSYTVTTS